MSSEPATTSSFEGTGSGSAEEESAPPPGSDGVAVDVTDSVAVDVPGDALAVDDATGVAGVTGGGNVDVDSKKMVSQVPMEGGPSVASTEVSALKLTQEELLMRHEEESFYSSPPNEHGDDNIWGLLSGVMGNIYEWYDFAVYGLLASEIGAAFFPESSKELQLLSSFGVYLAAFLMRPIGAIMFGELGDRIVGRRNALVFSIVLITVPSVLMGLLPPYEVWGTAAPVLLVLLRMMQGLSVGGQLAGSYVLSVEQSTARNRGFRGSICDASSVGGFLLASGVTTTVRHVFSAEAVNNWAWRVPFWFSLLLAPVLYHIVKQSEESKFWSERSDQKEAEEIIREEAHSQTPAVLDLISSPFRRRQLFGMVGVLSATTSSFYILFLWSPVYLSDLRGIISEKNAGLMNFFVVGIYIVMLVGAGKLSDSFPHRMDLMRIGLPGIIIACPVMFAMFESESGAGYFFAQVQFALCMACCHGGIAAWEVELWMADPGLSFTGVAIGHNLAATLFGGTMPLMATFLFYRSEELSSNEEEDSFKAFLPRLIPGLYVSLLGFFAWFCLSFVIRHPHDVRTGEKKIRDAYLKEDRRKKKRAYKKKKKRQSQTSQMGVDEGYWTSPTSTFQEFQGSLAAVTEEMGSYVPPASKG